MRIHRLIVIAGLGAALAAPMHAQTGTKPAPHTQTVTKPDTGGRGHNVLRTTGSAVKHAASAAVHATHRAFTKTVEFTKDRFGHGKPAKRAGSASKRASTTNKSVKRAPTKTEGKTAKADAHKSPPDAGKTAKTPTKP